MRWACPLCLQVDLIFFTAHKEYGHCQNCDLISLNPAQHVSSEIEKKRYDQHENNFNDVGYENHLNQILLPLSSYVKKEEIGLDYGCGRTNQIEILAARMDLKMNSYDPIYRPDNLKINLKYDFITSTEVVEHFRDPKTEWIKMLDLVKTGGFIAIMTQQHEAAIDNYEKFKKWWYIRDITHVVFYSEKTFRWIEEYFNLKIEYIKNPIVILKKQ